MLTSLPRSSRLSDPYYFLQFDTYVPKSQASSYTAPKANSTKKSQEVEVADFLESLAPSFLKFDCESSTLRLRSRSVLLSKPYLTSHRPYFTSRSRTCHQVRRVRSFLCTSDEKLTSFFFAPRIDTFSKTICPGSRLGFFTGSALFLERLQRASETSTQSASGFSQVSRFELNSFRSRRPSRN